MDKPERRENDVMNLLEILRLCNQSSIGMVGDIFLYQVEK